MKLSIAPLAVVFLALVPAGRVGAIQKGTQEKPDAANLKPGQYTWEAPKESKGAVDIVIHLGAQTLSVYQDGLPIGRSTISSGSKGRETPAGIYMILEKNLTHHSNKYHEASMPFMERLTWSGLAIHAGNTPGHPESHGCVHVPEDFARKLYEVTQEGDTVLIANADNPPEKTADPNLLFSDADAPNGSPAPGELWKPEEVASGPVSIVFTSADKHVYVYRKGVEIGHAEIGGAGKPFGDHVFVALAETLPDGSHQWNRLGAGDDSPAVDLRDLAASAAIPLEFRKRLQSVIVPGTTLVLTDRPANPSKPTHPD